MPTYDDPGRTSCFFLDLGGKIVAVFSECSGPTLECEVIEHKEVNERGQQVLKKMPSNWKPGTITLKQGRIKESQKIYEWLNLAKQGKKEALWNGSIVLMDSTLENEIGRCNFRGAFPSKVETSTLKAGENSSIQITLTLVPQDAEWV
jgi:phage tail-like protein